MRSRLKSFVAETSRVALPGTLLLLGCLLSTWLYARMNNSRNAYNAARRNSMISSVEAEIQTRLAIYESLLRGAASFLSVTGEPSPAEWRRYVTNLGVFEHNPGTEAMSLIESVSDAELDHVVARERREVSPKFNVHSIA